MSSATNLKPFQLACLSCAMPRKYIKMLLRLEEAEIRYGTLKMQKASELAKETPHSIFYWLNQLEYEERI